MADAVTYTLKRPLGDLTEIVLHEPDWSTIEAIEALRIESAALTARQTRRVLEILAGAEEDSFARLSIADMQALAELATPLLEAISAAQAGV